MWEVSENEIDLRERSAVSLAFLGDGVLELLVRARLVAGSRMGPGELHREAAKIVSAKGQAQVLQTLEPLLSEREAAVLRRGRNANKQSAAKNATSQQYHASTGLEAVFGWLYLQNEQERILELFEHIWQDYLQSAQNQGLNEKVTEC